ncbi:unnamed protein product [Phaedon cochleariae]|uniref:C2 domain-containing protein n=1 Tax=Phaedon cochleariae TaxID=80249 RepID=A0A9N9X4K5_PHACE|nr:unnamed protein product [Phaedon cochleariae]
MPELYRKELIRQPSTDSNGGQEMEYCGKLHFALKYDKELEGLVVKVFESRDLPVKDMNGSCDPYIKLYLLPDRKKKFQTKVHRKNQNPVFNETFIFSFQLYNLKKKHIDESKLTEHGQHMAEWNNIKIIGKKDNNLKTKIE